MITLDIFPSFYRFTNKELEELLRSIVLLIDSREQQNDHIVQYFKDKGIPYKKTKLDCGDYGVMLPANPNLGIAMELFFPVVIERKNSIDELAATFRERDRFEHELARSQKLRFLPIIEDEQGYRNILKGRYKS